MKIKEPSNYSHGYIFFPGVTFTGLLKEIAVKGKTLYLKEAFHITLICTDEVAKIIAPDSHEEMEQKLHEVCDKYLANHDMGKISLTNKFRFVEQDDNKTIIVGCKFHEGEKFFDYLRKEVNSNIPNQPFHITLYVTEGSKGIGIVSEEIMNKISQPLELPQLQRIKIS